MTLLLSAHDSYDGHMCGIVIHLWRGAYRIDRLEIAKTNATACALFQGKRDRLLR